MLWAASPLLNSKPRGAAGRTASRCCAMRGRLRSFADRLRLLPRLARVRLRIEIVFGVCNRDSIRLARPRAEIDRPAAFRAEWAEAVCRAPLGRLAALGATDDT